MRENKSKTDFSLLIKTVNFTVLHKIKAVLYGIRMQEGGRVIAHGLICTAKISNEFTKTFAPAFLSLTFSQSCIEKLPNYTPTGDNSGYKGLQRNLTCM